MFRTTVTTALVALALAPAAMAQPNTGSTPDGNGTSTQTVDGDHATCGFLRDAANSASDAASQAYHSGNKARGRRFERKADEAYEEAAAQGCAWAA